MAPYMQKVGKGVSQLKTIMGGDVICSGGPKRRSMEINARGCGKQAIAGAIQAAQQEKRSRS